jgi:hypothetical protein
MQFVLETLPQPSEAFRRFQLFNGKIDIGEQRSKHDTALGVGQEPQKATTCLSSPMEEMNALAFRELPAKYKRHRDSVSVPQFFGYSKWITGTLSGAFAGGPLLANLRNGVSSQGWNGRVPSVDEKQTRLYVDN